MAAIAAFQANLTVQLGSPSQTYGIRVTDQTIDVAVAPFEATVVSAPVAHSSQRDRRIYCCSYDNRYQVVQNKVFFVLRRMAYLNGVDSCLDPSTRERNVWCFDPETSTVECVLGPLNDPHFLRNRVVEFAAGINEVKVEKVFRESEVLVYDLTQPQGQKHIATYIVSGSGGWVGRLNPEDGTMKLWNRYGNTVEYGVMWTERVNGQPERFRIKC